MIDDKKRIRQRDFFNWDFSVETNDLNAFQLMPTITKAMNVPSPPPVFRGERHNDKQCNDCKYKRAAEEILKVLELCNLVRKSEKKTSNEPKAKGHRIQVE